MSQEDFHFNLFWCEFRIRTFQYRSESSQPVIPR